MDSFLDSDDHVSQVLHDARLHDAEFDAPRKPLGWRLALIVIAGWMFCVAVIGYGVLRAIGAIQ